MHLEIVTPSGKVFESDVESVMAPGISGRFQLLNNHADMVSGLDIGMLRIVENGKEDAYTCNGGVLEILENKVSILTEASEHVDSIDSSRAEASKVRAEERLTQSTKEVDHKRAKIALVRAINRISNSK